jgi:two-component system, NarL family, nitrate/nitrite response regulator NarL
VIRILIADDHTIFRDGLRNLLSRNSEYQVVGEARDGNEALKLVEQLQPDILLLDVMMPKRSGLDVLRSLAQTENKVRTIVLSDAIEDDDHANIFKMGARGLVLKNSHTGVLLSSIRAVMDGQYWVGQDTVTDLIASLKKYKKLHTTKPKDFGLTRREMEVIRAVVSGHSNKEIASLLSISEQTVKHHLSNIFDKLGVYNRLELTLFVFHHSIVEK